MPAQITSHSQDLNGKTLGHVNLMVDTLRANATIEDLRAITKTARSRLRQTNAKRTASTNGLFATGLDSIHAVPTHGLVNILARARSLYGAGMGFAGLSLLSSVANATVGLRWEKEGTMVDTLAVIDTDISQAIQSCKEELSGGRIDDVTAAQETVGRLWASLEESCRDVEIRGGEFPFDRATSSSMDFE